MSQRFKYIMVDLGDCSKIYTLDDNGKLLKKPKRNPKRNMVELVQEITNEPEPSNEPMEPSDEPIEPNQRPPLFLTFPLEVMDHFFQLWKSKSLEPLPFPSQTVEDDFQEWKAKFPE